MPRTIQLVQAAVAAILCVFVAGAASAQGAGGCTLQAVSGMQLQTLRCERGVSITTERGARFQLLDRNGDGRVDAARLDSKAMLIDVDSGRVKGGFIVVTPQAIAAVRGTRWAIDVGQGKTSVLVLRGRVSVRHPQPRAPAGVVLGPGQGVDVDSGTSALEVKQWGAPRVAALMARLGQ
jgi:ferric-dicitrate binding protein FerR (iron transport regulator)